MHSYSYELEQVQDKDGVCVNDYKIEDCYDCQFFGGSPEAAESAMAWDRCKNNPGHTTFIPISEFCLEHLPELYRSQSVLDSVKTIADVTVKLVVKHNSKRRIEFERYCYSLSEDATYHVGSGWIVGVKKGYGACIGCPECSPTSATQLEGPPIDKGKWFSVSIVTATHVVFNVDEAEATEVQIFYKDKLSRKDKRMKIVYGESIERGCTQDDSCVLRCVTHDKHLATELELNVKRMREIFVKQDREYNVKVPEWEPFPENRLCIMVSHPHGQPTMVTLGERKQIDIPPEEGQVKESTEHTRLVRVKDPIFYNTKSCPGSSGAPVFMPKCIETRRKDPDEIFSVADALVIRSHSLGNVKVGVGMSAGLPPLQILPPPALVM
ncbi:hypothetical protein PoB_001802700 [Plakobranchus ocellatus]|uniref:Peptidase S1 domain-containing protein n=1 Tax=Plakobranchus ocellatus TaxID=259542 RepID=A0AAV3ZAG6_9GAST|nr:hypothetical protein PoB_001802700 [Plakobranchus ocellatus]